MTTNEQIIELNIILGGVSNTWTNATQQQKGKFLDAVTTFSTLIEYYADKYRTKKTLKGEFISCVLWDFYYDLCDSAVSNLDYELDYWYEGDIDNFTNRLLDESSDPKKWIKKLKAAYRENEVTIRVSAFDKEKENYDLDSVNDFSEEYRDYLY